MKKSTLCLSIMILFIGIIVWTHQHSRSVFKLKHPSKVIVLDVGHGGSDPGKVNASGVREKDINLQIALYLKDYLIAQDYTVYITRDTDCDLSEPGTTNKKVSDLNHRIQFFSEKNADYVVSIHQNSFPDASSHGAQVFYYKDSTEGKMFAEILQDTLLSFDSTNHRKAKANDSYFLFKKSSVPTIIVECGFLSNPEEAANLCDSNYQKNLAASICLGICQYTNNVEMRNAQ